MTFEEEFPSLKDQDCPDYDLLHEIFEKIIKQIDKNTKSVSFDGIVTLKNWFSTEEKFDWIVNPRKNAFDGNPLHPCKQYDQETIKTMCLDKQRVREAIDRQRKYANRWCELGTQRALDELEKELGL